MKQTVCVSRRYEEIAPDYASGVACAVAENIGFCPCSWGAASDTEGWAALVWQWVLAFSQASPSNAQNVMRNQGGRGVIQPSR